LDDPAGLVGRTRPATAVRLAVRIAAHDAGGISGVREIDHIEPAAWGMFGEAGPVGPEPFAYPIADFYRTDPISRASATMGQCSERFAGRPDTSPRTGTHG
jgi:NADH-quinone oxidoreductase subunit G